MNTSAHLLLRLRGPAEHTKAFSNRAEGQVMLMERRPRPHTASEARSPWTRHPRVRGCCPNIQYGSIGERTWAAAWKDTRVALMVDVGRRPDGGSNPSPQAKLAHLGSFPSDACSRYQARPAQLSLSA